MNVNYFSFLLIGSQLLLSGCSATGTTNCNSSDCARPVSNEQQLSVWWSPALRDGQSDYSRVPLHE
ncbi:HrpT family type III secretion system protein [Pseudomonas sp. GM50]|uniref:HrpT family type III secretion system protein n=1 Tax=Pseudomonas sp. GM50 TaxID=1144332 RepID=UPI002379B821|nr:HrpT family type III secretion system protein [Pseudomonas sp. GM50]